MGARWRAWMRWVFVLGVLAWLAHRLGAIGWEAVWASRPRTPWFYALWVGLYLQLPLVEALVFRSLWGLPIRRTLVPLLHKRTLNQDVVSGLGEAYVFLWARRRTVPANRRIAGTLKDNLIASSAASWLAILLLLLCSGPDLLTMVLGTPTPLHVAAGVVVVALTVAVIAHFRGRLLTLEPGVVLRLTAVHFGRVVLLVYLLQVAQWWVVEPEAPIRLWIAMLVITSVIGRVPFLPARDLLGVGAVLGLLALPARFEASIAAMLLMRTVLDKLGNLAFALIHVVHDRPIPASSPGTP